jgi:serine protease Do
VAGVAGSALTLAVLATVGVFATEPVPQPPPERTIIREVVEKPVIAPLEENRVAAIAEQAIPSVVHVKVGQTGVDGRFLTSGSGSGVVYRDTGYIVTNNHVVEIGPEVQITFPDGRTYPATIEGADPLTDIAVVKVDVESINPIPLADITTLSIGDLAVAVGNPLGLQGGPSVTSGIVSALARSLEVGNGMRLHGLIQTDAPITRGSSGGALLNDAGELIGITTAIGTSGIAAEGLGFAVPVDIVVGVADDLIRSGQVRHAFLGLTGLPAFEQSEDGASVPIGARIEGIEDGSAIAEAGARVGDIIVGFDGQTVEEMNKLVALLRNYRADDVVTVTLLRDGSVMEIEVRLGLRPDDL